MPSENRVIEIFLIINKLLTKLLLSLSFDLFFQEKCRKNAFTIKNQLIDDLSRFQDYCAED